MGFSESTSLGEIGSLIYKDVKRLFCGGGADIGAKVVELDKENQKMVVMCDADNAGWEQRPWKGC